jgi:hypothetical protein
VVRGIGSDYEHARVLLAALTAVFMRVQPGNVRFAAADAQ